MFGDRQSAGHSEAGIGELSQAGGEREADRCRCQAGERRANGAGALEGRTCAGQDGARHLKKSGGVLCAGVSLKYAWIERHKNR